MMTIDEAIEHFKIIEQDSRQEAINIESNLYLPKSIDRDRLVTDCNNVADTNKQIVEWLEELKSIKENNHNFFDKCMRENYNKAIDDFETKILGNCASMLKDGERVIVIRADIFKFILEQLKDNIK